MDITLLHVPPSFYSQIARLGLAEKGVTWRERFAIAGPPAFDSYRPWYLRLNPNGTVPTLLIDGEAVPDSRAILELLDERFEGPTLVPEDPAAREAMQGWVDRLYEIPVRVMTYGAPAIRKVGTRINRFRLKALAFHANRNPDLARLYEAKREDIAGLAAQAQQDEAVNAARAQLDQALDDLDAALAEHEFIIGSTYTLADVVWTVMVARCFIIGFDPLQGRPSLARWYGMVKARPSFARADVWERFRPQALLRVMAWRYGLQALIGLVLVVAVAWGATRLW